MAQTSSAEVRAAQELRANETPAAQYYLKLAQDQMNEARQLMESGENERAERILVRAQADAELAVALAKEVETERAAQAAQTQLNSLRAK